MVVLKNRIRVTKRADRDRESLSATVAQLAVATGSRASGRKPVREELPPELPEDDLSGRMVKLARHSRFRVYRAQAHEGSNPSPATNYFTGIYLQFATSAIILPYPIIEMRIWHENENGQMNN